ncbi:MAG: hypothetical protein N0C90_23915 [Candidatus Thiodiazotropha endolucinida]|nr:hypothetical protein [Candidatus Thiodiazotropha taylori]MCW4264400.1 hypothetical protein [Candidatus Thiodiazotropha endolucinida]
MSTDISKLCADFLRTHVLETTGTKLKATHARELVAAFFGYKSHAAQLAETTYPLSEIEDAYVLVPDIPLMGQRRECLQGLPEELPDSSKLASALVSFLEDEQLFGSEAWIYSSLSEYVIEILLPKEDLLVSNQLSGVMAETNAYFDDPWYEEATVEEGTDEVTVIAVGQYNGTNHEDKPFCGDCIDMTVRVELYRIAGRAAFMNPDISAGGEINDDWVDPELRYGKP